MLPYTPLLQKTALCKLFVDPEKRLKRKSKFYVFCFVDSVCKNIIVISLHK